MRDVLYWESDGQLVSSFHYSLCPALFIAAFIYWLAGVNGTNEKTFVLVSFDRKN